MQPGYSGARRQVWSKTSPCPRNTKGITIRGRWSPRRDLTGRNMHRATHHPVEHPCSVTPRPFTVATDEEQPSSLRSGQAGRKRPAETPSSQKLDTDMGSHARNFQVT